MSKLRWKEVSWSAWLYTWNEDGAEMQLGSVFLAVMHTAAPCMSVYQVWGVFSQGNERFDVIPT